MRRPHGAPPRQQFPGPPLKRPGAVIYARSAIIDGGATPRRLRVLLRRRHRVRARRGRRRRTGRTHRARGRHRAVPRGRRPRHKGPVIPYGSGPKRASVARGRPWPSRATAITRDRPSGSGSRGDPVSRSDHPARAADAFAERSKGAWIVAAIRTGRVHRPSRPRPASTLQRGKGLRPTEMLRAGGCRGGTFDFAVGEGTHPLGGALVERPRPRRRAASIEDVLAGDPAVLEAARDADAQRASGADLGPLHGLPITPKDSYETAGLRTVCGRTDLKDHVPDQDAEAVRRLRSAGAVIIGKTNMPAGNQDVQAGNPMFGPTLNPWNTARTSGGSAGGGAVAAAAGLTALDFGSPAKSASRAAHHCENTCMPPSASHRSPTGAPSAAPCPRHTAQLRLRQRRDEAPSGCPHPRPAAASRHASDSSARMRSKDR